MARQPALSLEKLTELGVEKLAQLVLDEAERDAGFRRQVKAALAGRSGPEAIVSLIDKRLAGLERAKSFVDWDRARAFRDDLRSLTDTITAELGSAAPALAIDRLLRFIATHEQVFERVDDSSGSVQGVYYQAIAAAGDLTRGLPAAEADHLPEKIMAALGESEHGYLSDLAAAVVPHLPQATLARWDGDLSVAVAERRAQEARLPSRGWSYSMTSQWSAMRQTIALARGDIDLLIALEAKKPAHMQDTLGVAEQLLVAGRAKEALVWVRRPGRHEYGEPATLPKQVSLEARILETLDDKPAAQALRWRCFEGGLSAETLREYLKALPDFEDLAAEERALTLAKDHADPTAALTLFLGRVDKTDPPPRSAVIQGHLYVGGDLGTQPDVGRRMGIL